MAIAVGKTKDGESLPAKPGHLESIDVAATDLFRSYRAWRIPCRCVASDQYALLYIVCVSRRGAGKTALIDLLVHDNGGGLVRHGEGVRLRMRATEDEKQR